MELVIDFETVDPYLNKLGSGWVHGQLTVIGASVYKTGMEAPLFLRDKEDIIKYVEKASTLIAHNLQYDVGILVMWGVDIKDKTLIDTLSLAKLYNNVLKSYSLDNLSKHYLGETKSDDAFADVARRFCLYKTTTGKRQNIQDKAKLVKYAKEHMDEIDKVAPQTLEKYANQDVSLTYKLYNLFKAEISQDWIERLSNVYHSLLDARARGVRIDLNRLSEVRNLLFKKEKAAKDEVYKLAGKKFNIAATRDLAQVLQEFKVKLPLTPTGLPSTKSKALEESNHPLCKAVTEFRKYNKARKDFCDNILDLQDLLPQSKRGRIYPEFNVLEAVTGRFSCRNPNIQQIPARDKEIGPLIRSCYLPEEGEKWCSLDFSAQEFRIFAHYAVEAGVEGGWELGKQYCDNPNLDYHQAVADMCTIERKPAKAINFGTLYGMGKKKLCAQLGLGEIEGEEILKKYHEKFPAAKALSKLCEDTLNKRHFIYTILRRRSYEDPKVLFNGEWIGFNYKGLNKLIQGSASDQVYEAISQLYKAGIPLLFTVHDECNFSLPSVDLAEKCKTIMENCVKLNVPMVSEMGIGDNWADAK